MAFRHTTPEGREYISHRPQVTAREAMVASGHHYASQAGLRILEKGGNAIDAGVAAGICLSVLHSDMVSFLGVAPTIIYLAKERRVLTISGLGRWPKAASIEWFEKNCGGDIPPGVRRAVTPAAVDAWLTALARYGTMTFAEAAEDAISLAENGFAMHHFMHEHIKLAEADYYRWESTRPVYFPGGDLIPVGGRVRIPDLAETMRRMVRAEQSAGGGRAGGVRAARDEVYTGETARLMIDFIGRNGGLMTMDDLADFHVLEEEPVMTEFLGHQVYACGPWCQGPTLLEAMNIVSNFDLLALGHNSAGYLHALMSALNLAFADREGFIGDPRVRGRADRRPSLQGIRRDAGGAGRYGLRIRRHARSRRPMGAPGGRASVALRRRAPRSASVRARIPARHLLLHGGGFGGKRVFLHAFGPRERDALRARRGGDRIGARLPELARPGAPERTRALEAAEAHAEPRPHPQGRGVLHDAGHTGRRRPAPGHAAGLREPRLVRYAAADGDRSAEVRHLQFPQFLLAPCLRAGEREGGGAAFERHRRRAHARWAIQDGFVARFRLAARQRLRHRERPRDGLPARRRRPEARVLRRAGW